MAAFKYLAAAAAAVAFAAPASAAQFLTLTGPSGNFGNDNVMCMSGSCDFTNTFNFAGVAGFNLASLDISSVATSDPLTDINFTSVTFNGVEFNTVLTGVQEFRNLLSQPLLASNTLVVSGTTGGNASFSGNISLAQVAAVPEPGTWAMMLLGFGAVGWSMRRQRRTSARLLQTA